MSADASVKTSVIHCPQYRPRMLYFGVTSGAAEIETLTFPTVAGATQGDFVVLYNQAGQSIAAYINIDAAGVVPTSTLYTGATFKVAIAVSTGGTAAQTATAFVTAVGSTLPNVTYAPSSATVVCTQGLVGDCTNAVFKNSNGSGAGSITGVIGTAGSAVAMGNGKYDGTMVQTVTGTYVLTFDHAYLRAPEVGVTCKTDNRFARVSASAVGSVTIEVQNIVGGATANGDFSLFVIGSDAKDAIVHP